MSCLFLGISCSSLSNSSLTIPSLPQVKEVEGEEMLSSIWSKLGRSISRMLLLMNDGSPAIAFCEADLTSNSSKEEIVSVGKKGKEASGSLAMSAKGGRDNVESKEANEVLSNVNTFSNFGIRLGAALQDGMCFHLQNTVDSELN